MNKIVDGDFGSFFEVAWIATCFVWFGHSFVSWPSWRRLDEFWFWQREEKLVEMEWIVGQVGGSPGCGPVVVVVVVVGGL